MSQVIEVPGQGQVEFPDGMSDEDIVAAIKKIQLGPKVEPNALQRRMGIRGPRVKDERFLQNVAEGRKDLAYQLGGVATDVTGSPAVGALVNTATDVGTDPLTYAGGLLGDIAKPFIKSGGERVMQMALKPSKAARDSGDAVKAVKTLLEEGVNVSEGGVAKLTSKIDALDDALDEAIKSSKGALKSTDVLESLKGIVQRYSEGTMQAKDLADIKAVSKAFLEHPAFGGGDTISVQAAQAMKRANDLRLAEKYGKGLGEVTPEVNALKGINAGLRSGIAQVAPEAAAISRSMSPLINARDLAAERALAAGNNNIVSLGWLHPTTVIPWMAERSPFIASLLARGLYSGVAPLAPSAGLAAGAGIGQLIQQQGQE